MTRAALYKSGACVHLLAGKLLRRHVARRTENGARPASASRHSTAHRAGKIRAMPKSSTRTCKRTPLWLRRKILSGLMSRWTMPLSCAVNQRQQELSAHLQHGAQRQSAFRLQVLAKR